MIFDFKSGPKLHFSKYFILLFTIFNLSCFGQNFDIMLLKKINLNRNENLDGSFKLITNATAPVCLATPLVIYTIGFFKNNKELKEKGIFIGETVLISSILTTVLKMTIKRKRPYESYPEIENLLTVESYSFPSGHTSLTFATATALSISFPKWYVIVPSYTFASAVGYSRMHLGVHYPGDVLFGAILGSSSAFLTIQINKWLNPERQKFKKLVN